MEEAGQGSLFNSVTCFLGCMQVGTYVRSSVSCRCTVVPIYVCWNGARDGCMSACTYADVCIAFEASEPEREPIDSDLGRSQVPCCLRRNGVSSKKKLNGLSLHHNVCT